jgi:tellurite resistance protein TerC
LDLFIFRKDPKGAKLSRLLLWVAAWVFLAVLFTGFLYVSCGYEKALQFFSCYVIEKSLSIDNLFVFCLIFSSMKIPEKFHHKVLYWGVIGAAIMRITFILLGVEALKRFEWLYIVFGAFLVFASVRLALSSWKKDKEESIPFYHGILKLFPRPVEDLEKGRFFVVRKNKLSITSIFVALCMIEVADVIFAHDSLPAVLGITTDVFIVYTSNIFAILGLRSLYFVLQRIHVSSKPFQKILAAVLFLIGVKMLISKW